MPNLTPTTNNIKKALLGLRFFLKELDFNRNNDFCQIFLTFSRFSFKTSGKENCIKSNLDKIEGVMLLFLMVGCVGFQEYIYCVLYLFKKFNWVKLKAIIFKLISTGIIFNSPLKLQGIAKLYHFLS